MTIHERVVAASTTALREGRTEDRLSLQFIAANLFKWAKGEGLPLCPDEYATQYLHNHVNGLSDLLILVKCDEVVSRIRHERDLVRSFLPVALTDQELDALIEELKRERAYTTIRDTGKMIADILERHPGQDRGRLGGKIKASWNSK